MDKIKHYRFFSGCQYRFRVEDGKLISKPGFVGEKETDLVGFTPFPCLSDNGAGLKGEKSPESGILTGGIGDTEFSYLSKVRVGSGGQAAWKNLLGRTIPWAFFRFRFEAKEDGMIDTRFDAGPSSDQNGPDDSHDYSLVPSILVYRRYFNLQSKRWQAELVRDLAEQRRPFMSIGTEVQGAAFVIP